MTTWSREELSKVLADRERWTAEELAQALQRLPRRRRDFTTDSGIPIPDVVDAATRGAPDEAADVGLPGRFPFTRGTQPTMYRGRLWTMRQFAGFGSPEDTNRRFKYLLAHGVNGLSTAFDMPALMGYDADHAMSRGEVGKEGVAVSSLRDFELLFDGIPLGDVTTSMTINATAPIALAMYVAVAEAAGTPRARLGGTLQNDMLKEYIAQKEWMIPPAPAVRINCDVIEFCAAEMPRWNPVSVSGYHIREAGATAVQELAFTLADGLQYVQDCVGRGMDVDAFAQRLSFFWDVHNDFFEEVAKFRAARRMWARLLRDRFQARKLESLLLRTHAQTAGVSLTAQQPINNVVRVALQAFAAVLGGTQSLHTNSMDETYALPTEAAVTIALRTQQIIAFESGADRVVDPLAGSHYVEWLTDEMERRALELIGKIDAMGGMLKAVENGFPQREIAESAFRWQLEVERGDRTVVGVNAFRVAADPPIATLKVDESVQHAQIERLQAVKAGRSAPAVAAALTGVERAAREGRNVMPPILAAVKTYATLGELSDVLRKVHGTYREDGRF
ncbi:MAG: methylmalonyl-CoA mutase family protein [Anaeromyxobacter sp.]|nr:methylmalonyl-CoA mutase family protein [Anaeromyxobacter sp.]MBL0277756.1 methylmalonyl-CoA mutase family protein [Anaeromyxobacter sp.]